MEPAAKKTSAASKTGAVADFSLQERLGYEKELLGFLPFRPPARRLRRRRRRLPHPHRRATARDDRGGW
ncbi:MAG: hypothetical protein WDO13_05405 [Verrucomicrobiota bacterium]